MSVRGDGGQTQASEPQAAIDDFWDSLITKKPAKVTKIFPQSLYANLLPPQRPVGTVVGKNAAQSYQAAAEQCCARVKRIVKECHRTNEKFTDAEFDISDLTDKSCLEGLMYWYEDVAVTQPATTAAELGQALATLVQSGIILSETMPTDIKATAKILAPLNYSTIAPSRPRSVHRIDWIFENPKFVVDCFSKSELRQGSTGDCWFVAAVSTISTNPALLKRVCVAKDEECGVYGFVFYRDGEWVWTVVDDSLYLVNGDFDAEVGDRWDPTNAKEAKWRKNHQTGSEALYFASCANENETWLPLLEKAYAKMHGDYDSICGGSSGEAVEDLTGGVTTKILTDRVLSKEKLWKELLQVGKEFLFSASSPSLSAFGVQSEALRGLALSHAYSILRAVEEPDEDGKPHRLLLIRNPWGKKQDASVGEWTGPWSDGSREWTPYWLDKLGHTFGDDGLFWMSYEDLLKRFDLLDRTRLFDEQWTVVQRWTSLSVAWVTGYLNTKFSVEIKKAGPTVFVLCQLDDRYFQGLQGRYTFDLHFVLQEKDSKAGEHLVRARSAWFGNRSVAAEVNLEAGVYEVVPKIVATRDLKAPEAIDVVKRLARRNPQKLRQIGLNYDMANAKGVPEIDEEEKDEKDEKGKEEKEGEKKEQKEEVSEEKKTKEEKPDEKVKDEADEKKTAGVEAQKKASQASFAAWKKFKQAKQKKKGKKEDKKGKKASGSQEDEATGSEIHDALNANAEEGHNDNDKDKDANQEEEEPIDIPALAEQVKANPPTSDSELKQLLLMLTDYILYPADDDDDDDDDENSNNNNADDNKNNNNDDADENDANNKDDNPDKDNHDPTPPTHPMLPTHPSPAPDPHFTVTYTETYPDKYSAKYKHHHQHEPWNAVCTLGLRVYSLDPNVTIQLIKPQSVAETAILDVDGGTQAGATM